VTFLARQPRAREETRERGEAHPESALLSEPESEFFKRCIGVLAHPLADQAKNGRITVRPTTAGVRPWSNLPGCPPPLQPLLHKRTADAEEHRQGSLGAQALVIGLQEFLSEVN
jgi:hypothetical protein